MHFWGFGVPGLCSRSGRLQPMGRGAGRPLETLSGLCGDLGSKGREWPCSSSALPQPLEHSKKNRRLRSEPIFGQGI